MPLRQNPPVKPASPPPRPKSWPLLLLGAAAFLPFFGVAFGFVAAVWGLLSSRPRALLAAALGAAGMLLNFAGCAALVYRSNQRTGTSLPVEMAKLDLAELARDLGAYHARHHRYPASLTELRTGPWWIRSRNLYDRSIGVFNLTRPYQYRPSPDRQRYTLFAVGPDGQPGTADDLYPPGPEPVAQQPSLGRPTASGEARSQTPPDQ